ncbi:hypothetical protein DSECCO2_638770 [anaerobic digester metagenome]
MHELDHLHGFVEGPGLLVGDPVAARADLVVVGQLLGVVGVLFEAAGFLGVVLDPGLDALDEFDARGVEIEAVHAGDAVAAGVAGHLGLFLAADVEQSVEAVFQRVVVAHDLAALGQGVAGVEHADHRPHDLFLEVVLGHLALPAVAEVVHRLLVPGLGDLVQRRHFLGPDAELAGDGDDLAEAFGDVAAARADAGELARGFAAPLEGLLVHLVLVGHEKALGQLGHGEGTAVVASLAGDDELARDDQRRGLGEGHGQGLRPAEHRNLVLVLGVGPVVPVAELHVHRGQGVQVQVIELLDAGMGL